MIVSKHNPPFIQLAMKEFAVTIAGSCDIEQFNVDLWMNYFAIHFIIQN